jgi:toxin-antitoxin system PIN domain toxin
MAYLRIATHSAIFKDPLSPKEAMDNIEALLGLPHVRVISEQPGFWDLYRDLTAGLTVRGNLVPDAHLASLLRQHEIKVIYTNDADYRKFPFLEVRNPLA